VAFSVDSRLVLTGSDDDTAELWDAATGKQIRPFTGHEESVRSVAFSPDGKSVLTGSVDATARLWNAATGKQVRVFEKPIAEMSPVEAVAISADGKYVLTASADQGWLWNAATGQKLQAFTGHKYPVVSIAISPDNRFVLTGSDDGTACLWDASTGKPLHLFEGHKGGVRSVTFSADGHYVLTGSEDGTARLWSTTGKGPPRIFSGHASSVTSAAISGDGRFVLTGSEDSTARVWDAATGTELAALLTFADGGWAVVDTEGRFDTSDLDGGAPLDWVADDDPMRALPLEIFMRDYYTPGLLARVMRGEKLPPIRSIAEIRNRVQPEVAVKSVAPSAAMPGRVDVVVHADSVTDEKGVQSGVQDLRLFRDGQMVAGGYLEGPLKDGEFTFKNVMLKSGAKNVTFTAYAFNSERIKSATASLEYVPPTAAASARKPHAYLLQIGVNHAAAPGCELQYADNDAEKLSAVLKQALEAQGMQVEPVVLESPMGGDAQGAAKERIRAAIAGIAAKATPDDVFFLSFSGHGYAASDGQYFMIPSDIAGSCLHVEKTLLASAISADELAEWLRPVDAGEMAFVLDACHSAESVEAGEFKPGPMGSRGLGQLAYDKRMRILVASQAHEVAVEYDKLQQGLLSYVLTQEGLRRGNADWKPVDHQITVGEWLSYTANAVPKFDVSHAEAARGLRVLGTPDAGPTAQIPAVFDFSKTDGFVLEHVSGQP
jgi:hypothetical protein